MPRPRSVFVCQQCGSEGPKWVGRCPDCEQWNTYVESLVKPVTASRPGPGAPVQEIARTPGSWPDGNTTPSEDA